MIGGRRSEEIRALRETAVADAGRLDAMAPQVEALNAQIAMLSAHVAMLSTQFAAEQDRLSKAAVDVTDLDRRLTDAEKVVVAQAATLRVQADEIERLNGRGEQQAEAIQQVWGALTRIDRQAAIDMDEMRRTSLATAQIALGLRPLLPVVMPDEPSGQQRDISDSL